MKTGERIRELRKKAGLTQKKLGDLCGIAEPTIRRYELGKLNPKQETLQKIAKPLGVMWYELYGDTDAELVKESMLEGMRISASRPIVLAEEEVLKPYRDKGYQFTDKEAICVKEFANLNDIGQLQTILIMQHLAKDQKYQANPNWLDDSNEED